MATISSLGIGSGLDVETLVTKLMAVEQQPITQINKKTDGLKTQLSTYGQVQSAVSTLRDAAAKLTSPETWAGTQASSTDASSVTATAGSGAAIGTVTVSVSQLAAAQTLASSTPYASSSTTVGQGSITIELGTWGTDADTGATTFASKSGATPVTITIGPGQDQLGQIRDQINAANAGVTAAVVTDASGSRLTLTSSKTGESNAFRVSVSDADGNNGDAGGLSALAYDPSNGTAQLSQTVSAANARAMLNGLNISSESNSLQSAIDGLNITLFKITSIPASITVSQDRDAIKKAIADFTTAYNAINQMLRTQTKYDDASKTAGPLQGDSTAVNLGYLLRRTIGSSTSLAGAAMTRLADVGLDPGTDGSITTSSTKLDTALNNLSGLKQLFMGLDSSTTGNDGFAQKIRSMADQVLGVGGSLATRQAGIQTEISNNNKSASALQDRADATEKRLRAQYSALDTKMSQLSSLSTYLTQQLAQMNKSS